MQRVLVTTGESHITKGAQDMSIISLTKRVVHDLLDEVKLSDCEYGCKYYTCSCGGTHLVHNQVYGCTRRNPPFDSQEEMTWDKVDDHWSEAALFFKE